MRITTVERIQIEHNGDLLEMSREAANRLFNILAEDAKEKKRRKENGNRKKHI